VGGYVLGGGGRSADALSHDLHGEHPQQCCQRGLHGHHDLAHARVRGRGLADLHLLAVAALDCARQRHPQDQGGSLQSTVGPRLDLL